MDTIIIDGLEVTCIIGVGTPERLKAQRILVHISLFVDTQLCGRTDALEHTVNYAALSKRVEVLCARAQCFTIESLCALVARECLFGPEAHGAVARMRVRIEKPEALKRARWPAVEIERTREYYEREDAMWGPPRTLGLAAPLAAAAEAAAATGAESPPVDVLLCLGSNEGARSAYLRGALALLAGRPWHGLAPPPFRTGASLAVVDTSWLYETAPAYVLDQSPFLNAAARIRTTLSPRELLRRAKAVEALLGRVSGGVRNGPRPVDVDIAMWGGGRIIDEPAVGAGDDAMGDGPLCVPHAALAERDFCLVPLCDIAPRDVHPKLYTTCAQMLERLGGGGTSGSVHRVLALPPPMGSTGAQDAVLFTAQRTHVVGVLNATPDSFSDGGDLERAGTGDVAKAAAARACAMVASGVDVIDIGGQSTRPGALSNEKPPR